MLKPEQALLLFMTRAFQAWWYMDIHASIWISTEPISTVIWFFHCFGSLPRCQEFVRSSLKTIWIQVYMDDTVEPELKISLHYHLEKAVFWIHAMISITPVNISSKLIVHIVLPRHFDQIIDPSTWNVWLISKILTLILSIKTFWCEYISSVLPALSLDH